MVRELCSNCVNLGVILAREKALTWEERRNRIPKSSFWFRPARQWLQSISNSGSLDLSLSWFTLTFWFIYCKYRYWDSIESEWLSSQSLLADSSQENRDFPQTKQVFLYKYFLIKIVFTVHTVYIVQFASGSLESWKAHPIW